MGKKRKPDSDRDKVGEGPKELLDSPDDFGSAIKKILVTDKKDHFYIHALYIGQGDCILIRCPDNKLIMIDCGSVADATRKEDVISDFLHTISTENGYIINYLIITHSDKDHHNKVKLLKDADITVENVILGNYSISDFYFSENKNATSYTETPELITAFDTLNHDQILLWEKWKLKYTKSNYPTLQLLNKDCRCNKFTGLTINSDESKKNEFLIDSSGDIQNFHTSDVSDGCFTVVNGTTNGFNWSVQIIAAEVKSDHRDKAGYMNSASLVTVCKIGELKAIFTGDSTGATFDYLLDHSSSLVKTMLQDNIALLQIPHHGSESHESDHTRLIAKTQPKLLFTSVKFGENSHHLPRWGALSKWKGGVGIARDISVQHYMGYWISTAELQKKRIKSSTNNPAKIPKDDTTEDIPMSVINTLVASISSPRADECFLVSLKESAKADKLLALKMKNDLIFVIQKTKKGITSNGSETLNTYFMDFISNQDVKDALATTLKIRALKDTAFDNLDATSYILTGTDIEVKQKTK